MFAVDDFAACSPLSLSLSLSSLSEGFNPVEHSRFRASEGFPVVRPLLSKIFDNSALFYANQRVLFINLSSRA